MSTKTDLRNPILDAPWRLPVEDALDRAGSSAEGLTDTQAQDRLRQVGENILRPPQRRSVAEILLAQTRSLFVLLLGAASAAAFVFGEWVQGTAIGAAIAVNAALGFIVEWRATRSMESLRELGGLRATIRRGGKDRTVRAEAVAPGDILHVDAGDLVVADARLIEASKLQVDESPMTGESAPVDKTTDPLEGEVSLAERRNMLYRGTTVTRGSGEAVVVATGMSTELGKVATMVEEAQQGETPLDRRLRRLGRRLVWLTLVIAAAVGATGFLSGRQLLLMIETSIALAVAAIPEGLPIVTNMALARGMWRMARRNALVNRLSAVEALGTVTTICSDKTGTLTENRMTARRLALASGEESIEEPDALDGLEEDALAAVALRIGVLCNNASLVEGADDQDVGDPLEIALLRAGACAGSDREALLEQYKELREVSFDPDIRMMATFHDAGDDVLIAVKGAPSAVLEASSHQLAEDGSTPQLDSETRSAWMDRADSLAADGYRVLALARRTVSSPDVDPYEDLTLLALIAMEDPPRDGVRSSIEECTRAGIRVVMVTGDQAPTAVHIARAVGITTNEDVDPVMGKALDAAEPLDEGDRRRILQSAVFARVSPRQKLSLIKLLQEAGAILLMVGDGVNDAPPLKTADVGVAMGQRGTQVARQAADVVLQDDRFETIVDAIREGRTLFGNIRSFIIYLLSGNLGEIIALGVASLVGLPLPLRPLQILFINILLDVFQSLALALGPASPGIMRTPPRDPREPILPSQAWWAIGGYGALIAVGAMGAFVLALKPFNLSEPEAVSVSFFAFASARLMHVFNMREPGSHPLRNSVTRNRLVWAALGLCTGLLAVALLVPSLRGVLSLAIPGPIGWGLVAAAACFPLLAAAPFKALHDRRSAQEDGGRAPD
jgi:Ca2+-transporting ATPase